ncbi:MAG: hypothetical protein SNG60_07860 [Rikenellaceae bacterium]
MRSRLIYLMSLALMVVVSCAKEDQEKITPSDGGDESEGTITLNLKSHYVDKIDYDGLTKCVVSDYNAVVDVELDQTPAFQDAITAISDAGGGILEVPAGIYHISGVYMRSNVHILVDSDVVFKPYMIDPTDEAESVIMFNFNYEKKVTSESNIVQNCSIRGVNGTYTVDYSDYGYPFSMRFALARVVRNFLIADVKVLDNYNKHCAITFSPADAAGADKWSISRPTDGEIRNISIDKANSGYGLCQLHGANRLYFENISGIGGVTLRLETGADVDYAGVFDIHARNIYNESGKAAAMTSPHTVCNGTVKLETVRSKSSSFAFFANSGFLDKTVDDGDNTATNGVFASDSEVVNIYAEYGTTAQVAEKDVYLVPESLYDLFTMSNQQSWIDSNNLSFIGPALSAVYDKTESSYQVKYQNVSSDGFPFEPYMYLEEAADRDNNKWDYRNLVPCYIDYIASLEAN